MRQAELFGLSKHLERLSRHGDPLEVLEATVNFEHFRGWLVEGLGYGDGSAADGRQLRRVVSRENTGSEVWADSAYRPEERELAGGAHADQPHPSPQAGGQADAKHIAGANAKKSSIRAAVEHVFAHQKNRFGLFVRTIGLARAEAN